MICFPAVKMFKYQSIYKVSKKTGSPFSALMCHCAPLFQFMMDFRVVMAISTRIPALLGTPCIYLSIYLSTYLSIYLSIYLETRRDWVRSVDGMGGNTGHWHESNYLQREVTPLHHAPESCQRNVRNIVESANLLLRHYAKQAFRGCTHKIQS